MYVETDAVYMVERDQLRAMFDIANTLHSGTDQERDLGHKLWLVLTEVRDQEVGTINTWEK